MYFRRKCGFMSDYELLEFIHNRLVKIHGENRNYDYMHRLRDIINNVKDCNCNELKISPRGAESRSTG